jgi:hypothetical protein
MAASANPPPKATSATGTDNTIRTMATPRPEDFFSKGGSTSGATSPGPFGDSYGFSDTRRLPSLHHDSILTRSIHCLLSSAKPTFSKCTNGAESQSPGSSVLAPPWGYVAQKYTNALKGQNQNLPNQRTPKFPAAEGLLQSAKAEGLERPLDSYDSFYCSCGCGGQYGLPFSSTKASLTECSSDITWYASHSLTSSSFTSSGRR